MNPQPSEPSRRAGVNDYRVVRQMIAAAFRESAGAIVVCRDLEEAREFLLALAESWEEEQRD